jgi:hypothetical protein
MRSTLDQLIAPSTIQMLRLCAAPKVAGLISIGGCPFEAFAGVMKANLVATLVSLRETSLGMRNL